MQHKIPNLVLVGLSAVALSACGSPPATNAGTPEFVEPGTTPTVTARPLAAPTPTLGSPSATPSGSPSASSTPRKISYTFPVIGRSSYARVHHDYPATDLMTDCGNQFVSVTSGTILAVSRTDRWDRKVDAGATRGGLSISVLGDDGVRYYGSHLSAIDKAIAVGVRVGAGQALGKTGRTGDASACHLHFGISPPCARQGDWWIQRGAIWPWPYLDSWRAGGSKSPVAEITSWHTKKGCPAHPQVDP